jgi:hypothetical protein
MEQELNLPYIVAAVMILQTTILICVQLVKSIVHLNQKMSVWSVRGRGYSRTLGLGDVLEIIKLKYMTKVDFTNWLHKELHEVFNNEQTPEQMMVRAIPMIDATFSQNSGKPTVISSAYWVELNGGNIIIVVAESVGNACDKLDAMNFENYSIKHDKTMVSLH